MSLSATVYRSVLRGTQQLQAYVKDRPQRVHREFRNLLQVGASPPAETRLFEGVWSGSYSTHGVEQVRLEIDDSGRLVAWKITGDTHVPAGEWSWRTTVGVTATDEHEVRAEVQLAEKGFKNPKVVPAKIAVPNAYQISLVMP